jgi:formylglycine-generating enzyme required for sulfatase activity
MVSISGGPFLMGPPERGVSKNTLHPDEPRLEVIVSVFLIAKYPVTAAEMCLFLNSSYARQFDRERLYYSGLVGKYDYSTIHKEGDVYVPDRGKGLPANQVTWLGAYEYCRWLTLQADGIYRLPTEVEWEYVAKGHEGRLWPWGATEPSARMGARWGRLSPVGSYPANETPDGVRDMLAYVNGEWCQDKYAKNPTLKSLTSFDADASDLTTHRVLRGVHHKTMEKRPILQEIFMVGGTHRGRAWTRDHFHPLDAPHQAAWFGFRVAQDAGIPEK